MSSASLILIDGGLALSEPKAVGARGSTKVLAASSLGSCLVFVSSAVVTVALAAIGRDMRLSPLDLQWVMNAELLPLAALTLVAGALGDRFGQKRIFLAGIALYGLGATAIGFAPSFAPLVVGRFLQGLGGALILPNGLSVLGQAFPADKKARAVGIWSAAAAVASGVAPAIAGAILDHGSWRTTFLMLLPVVAGALAVGTVWIPKDSPTSHARVDVGGAVFSTVGFGGLGAGLTSLTNGSGLNLWVLVTLIVGLGGLACLIVTERRLGDNAMLPPSPFASRSVVGANLFTALLYGAFTVMLTLDIGLLLFVARAICLRDKPETVLLVKLASVSVSFERPETQAIKPALRNIQEGGADVAALPRWQYVELVDPDLAKRYEANELLAAE